MIDSKGHDSFSNRCIICDIERKRHNGCYVKLCTGDVLILENLKKFAFELGDMNMYEKLENNNKQYIKYHKMCKVNYDNKWYSSTEKCETNWHKLRTDHNTAFAELSSFIEENVFKNKNAYHLTFLRSLYINSLNEINDYDLSPLSELSSAQSLENKISNEFGDKIRIIKKNGKKILQSSEGILPEAYDFEKLQKSDIIQEAAFENEEAKNTK